MEIIVGKTAGFCYGVKRAVEGAKEEIVKTKGKIYCLGEIVHNKKVIKQLEKQGMTFVNNIEEVDSKTILRAHGVKKEIYEIAKEKNIELKDYTCPNVLKIHEIVEEYSKKGYYIILCGSKDHPENIGTISYCGNNFFVIENEEEVFGVIDKIKEFTIKDILLISQTTYSLEKFKMIEENLLKELKENVNLIIKNTICKATEVRQKETEEISKVVDAIIIIGGKNSSNTRKLYEIANKNCVNCVCIESVEEIEIINFKMYPKIGIMAGASTPQESIDEVIIKLNELIKK